MEELPEGCIAYILSYTTPLDACRLAPVSKTFRSASKSDELWDKFLPSDFNSIVSRSSSPLLSSSKQDLFINVCHNPILIDGAKKSFWLEKRSGKKCYMIGARDLMIAWGGTPEYWIWINLPESRFAEVAELKFVWWLEIRGKIDTCMLSPATSYVAFLVFKLTEDAHGLDEYPTETSITIDGTRKRIKRVCLVPDEDQRSRRRWMRFGSENHLLGLERPKRREDGWLEIELGEYFNEKGEDGELEMSVMEVRSAKGGLVVQGIEIRPKIAQEI